MNAIDLPRLRADLRAVADSITALKRVLRATWTEPMAEHQRRLLQLKWRATELCVLRAHLRGRLHLAQPPASLALPVAAEAWDRAGWHAATAARVARDYASVDPAAAAAACDAFRPEAHS